MSCNEEQFGEGDLGLYLDLGVLDLGWSA
jgi:hypothetical protein